MKGTIWSKWDLHFHTPTSYDYGRKSTSNEEIVKGLVEAGVRAIAITDHHEIDVDRIQELQTLGQGKLTVFPGIEFLAELRGRDPIHFIGIFSEKCDIKFIWDQISNRTPIKEIRGQGKKHNEVYCNLIETLKLIQELGGITTIHAGTKTNTIENITNSLPHAMAQKTDIATEIDIYELGKETDQEGYQKFVFPSIGKILPMIICSDNHNIDDYKVKQNLWIKAEPTFEGLKQIIYEPENRVHIGANIPSSPLRTIDKIKFSIEEGTQIHHIEDKKLGSGSKFCLQNIDELEFSPNFTCIIGGRGTGKSTILSLIAESVNISSKFFEENKLILDGQRVDLFEIASLEGTEDIEFISQNQVETYANSEELTEAVYDRIRNLNYEDITGLEDSIESYMLRISEEIHNTVRKYKLGFEINNNNKEILELQKIVDHYNSEEYKKLTSGISNLSTRQQQIFNSKKRYLELVKKVRDLAAEFPVSQEIENEYEKEIERVTGILNQLGTRKEFVKTDTEATSLDTQISAVKVALDDYMRKQGVSEEDADEYERAVERLPILKNELVELKSDLSESKRKSAIFLDFDQAHSTKKAEFSSKITESLEPLNEKLKNIDQNVADIRFEYRFSEKQSTNEVSERFEKQFYEFKASENGTRRDAVKDYLFSTLPFEVDDYKDYLAKLEKHGSNANAKALIKKIFDIPGNFEIYKLIVKQVYNDVNSHKTIVGFYDNKEFRSCSFGQRCTAVIVALIMFGNKPIIIDEPEAHLDSKLIAEYLINLIKQKKRNRQIIFSTHNANFVVNGDADLIHCLEVDDNNLTRVYSTTIEDLDNRERLLALEGGEDAFRLRDKKLLK